MMISDNHTMTEITTNQWMMEFYNQQSPDDDLLQVSAAMEGLFSDVNNTVVTTSSSSHSPTSPKAGNNGAAGSRPIRRRSRASKKTPTTLLNANTTNFRALVQQFTGCPSSTAMSFEVYKGPITLNFQQGRRQVVRHHHNKSRTTETRVSSAATAPFGNTGFNNEGHHLHRQYQQQQQQLADQQQWRLQDHHHQQQQSGDHDDLFDYNSDLFSKPSMEISDGLIEDHNYSLQHVTMTNNAFFSNNDVIQNNGAHFM